MLNRRDCLKLLPAALLGETAYAQTRSSPSDHHLVVRFVGAHAFARAVSGTGSTVITPKIGEGGHGHRGMILFERSDIGGQTGFDDYDASLVMPRVLHPALSLPRASYVYKCVQRTIVSAHTSATVTNHAHRLLDVKAILSLKKMNKALDWPAIDRLTAARVDLPAGELFDGPLTLAPGNGGRWKAKIDWNTSHKQSLADTFDYVISSTTPITVKVDDLPAVTLSRDTTIWHLAMGTALDPAPEQPSHGRVFFAMFQDAQPAKIDLPKHDGSLAGPTTSVVGRFPCVVTHAVLPVVELCYSGNLDL